MNRDQPPPWKTTSPSVKCTFASWYALSQGKQHEALYWCYRAVEENPRSELALTDLVFMLRDLGLTREAKRTWQRLRRVSPELGSWTWLEACLALPPDRDTECPPPHRPRRKAEGARRNTNRTKS